MIDFMGAVLDRREEERKRTGQRDGAFNVAASRGLVEDNTLNVGGLAGVEN